MSGGFARPAPVAAESPSASVSRPAPASAPVDLSAARVGAGSALPLNTRDRMEAAFSRPFGDVRVHTDANAASFAQAQGAQAVTDGQGIAFGPGQFNPGTPSGDHLIAHELAHVAQGGVPGARSEVSQPHEPVEVAAEAAATRVTRGEAANVSPMPGGGLRGRLLRRALAGLPLAPPAAPSPVGPQTGSQAGSEPGSEAAAEPGAELGPESAGPDATPPAERKRGALRRGAPAGGAPQGSAPAPAEGIAPPAVETPGQTPAPQGSSGAGGPLPQGGPGVADAARRAAAPPGPDMAGKALRAMTGADAPVARARGDEAGTAGVASVPGAGRATQGAVRALPAAVPGRAGAGKGQAVGQAGGALGNAAGTTPIGAEAPPKGQEAAKSGGGGAEGAAAAQAGAASAGPMAEGPGVAKAIGGAPEAEAPAAGGGGGGGAGGGAAAGGAGPVGDVGGGGGGGAGGGGAEEDAGT